MVKRGSTLLSPFTIGSKRLERSRRYSFFAERTISEEEKRTKNISSFWKREKNDEALLQERNRRIEKLEATIAASEDRLPDVVLSRIKTELKSSNYERAYLGLEEWFQIERRYIGEAAKLLAQHYASYGEPEIARDAAAKARRAASVAVGCLDDILGFIDNPKNRLPRDDIGIRVRA
jgi:hypothetical protein